MRYKQCDFRDADFKETDLLVLAAGEDQRSLAVLQDLNQKEHKISTVLLIQYGKNVNSNYKDELQKYQVDQILLHGCQTDIFQYKDLLTEKTKGKNVLIDITEIRVPELFILMKIIHENCNPISIHAAYTSPMDYIFTSKPFTSYRSFQGDLKTEEIKGYGGSSFKSSYSKMIIFLGFEGALSKKVNEDIQYEKLILVNNLPSIYAKYKDISIINNYDLLNSEYVEVKYVPADNPFETYNFLSDELKDTDNACVAPLSTKVVALGVCMYALKHKNVRIVYPVAQKYVFKQSKDVFKTYVYEISFID